MDNNQFINELKIENNSNVLILESLPNEISKKQLRVYFAGKVKEPEISFFKMDPPQSNTKAVYIVFQSNQDAEKAAHLIHSLLKQKSQPAQQPQKKVQLSQHQSTHSQSGPTLIQLKNVPKSYSLTDVMIICEKYGRVLSIKQYNQQTNKKYSQLQFFDVLYEFGECADACVSNIAMHSDIPGITPVYKEAEDIQKYNKRGLVFSNFPNGVSRNDANEFIKSHIVRKYKCNSKIHNNVFQGKETFNIYIGFVSTEDVEEVMALYSNYRMFHNSSPLSVNYAKNNQDSKDAGKKPMRNQPFIQTDKNRTISISKLRAEYQILDLLNHFSQYGTISSFYELERKFNSHQNNNTYSKILCIEFTSEEAAIKSFVYSFGDQALQSKFSSGKYSPEISYKKIKGSENGVKDQKKLQLGELMIEPSLCFNRQLPRALHSVSL